MIKSEIKFERKPVFGDMMLAIAEKENCGNYNINIDYDYIYYKNNEPFIFNHFSTLNYQSLLKTKSTSFFLSTYSSPTIHVINFNFTNI